MKIYISAAEPSGDLIAAEVMAELPRETQYIGIGGEQMTARGLRSFFPMSELTVMGFSQVIPKIFSLLKRIDQTADYVIQENPDCVLTVDAYSFHCRLAKKLREKGYKGRLVQYVPPAVWAWKESRAKTLAQYYDEVFCIFPFEPDYFERAGMKATFVGHPAVYRLSKPDSTFRDRWNVPKKSRIVTILPGSRLQEINVLLPIYLEAAKELLKTYPDLCFFIPTFDVYRSTIEDMCRQVDVPVQLLTDIQEKYACFHESALAIAASGTVALELACYGVPTIIGYVTSSLNYWVARCFARVKYICTVNILADKRIIPELIQAQCTSENIVQEALSIFQDPDQQGKEARKSVRKLYSPGGEGLGEGEQPEKGKNLPSQIVARSLLTLKDQQS